MKTGRPKHALTRVKHHAQAQSLASRKRKEATRTLSSLERMYIPLTTSERAKVKFSRKAGIQEEEISQYTHITVMRD